MEFSRLAYMKAEKDTMNLDEFLWLMECKMKDMESSDIYNTG